MLTSILAGLRGRCRAGAAALVFCACHGGAGGVSFQGRTRVPIVAPDQVVETRALAHGVSRLGSLHAFCEAPARWQAFRDQALADVDCSEARLRRMLREAAAQNGGDVLFGLECETNGASSCRAGLGRGASTLTAPAPSRPLAVRGDVRGSRGANVRVDFSPSIPDPARPPRAEAVVGDLPLLPPSHVVVGTFATACTECGELEARDALRIAAARSGASDVVGIRCFQWGPGYRCSGAAAMTRVAQ